MTRTQTRFRSLGSRMLRGIVPTIAVTLTLTIAGGLFVSYRALVEATENVTTLRGDYLAVDFAQQFATIQSLELDSVAFYRRQLYDLFIETADANPTDSNGAMLVGRDLAILAPAGGRIRASSDLAAVLESTGGDANLRRIDGAQIGLPHGLYAVAARYNAEADVWIVAYESIAEAVAPLLGATVVIAIIAAISLAVSLLIVFGAARRVAQPLRQLALQVTAFGDGDSSARFDYHEASEVGVLADEFNRMADRISRFTLTLEERVAGRTTELKESLRRLEATKDQLVQAEKLAALTGLLTGFAHELNTPLGVALSATDFILQRLRDESVPIESVIADLRESAELAVSNMIRTAQMIQRFRQVSVDQQVSERSTVELAVFLEDMRSALDVILAPVRAELTIETAGNPLLNTYPGYLWQVVANLATNAVQHAFGEAPRDEDPWRLRVEAVDAGPECTIYVSDNGPGVPLESIDRLYEPFFTTRRSRGNSGLGLNIVYNVVTGQLGGRLAYLRPEERRALDPRLCDSGACFRIVLPKSGAIE